MAELTYRSVKDPCGRSLSIPPIGLGKWNSPSLIETDVSLQDPEGKDILDQGALGTRRTTHLRRQGLPRYQWTACDGRTRLRFLAYNLS